MFDTFGPSFEGLPAGDTLLYESFNPESFNPTYDFDFSQVITGSEPFDCFSGPSEVSHLVLEPIPSGSNCTLDMFPPSNNPPGLVFGPSAPAEPVLIEVCRHPETNRLHPSFIEIQDQLKATEPHPVHIKLWEEVVDSGELTLKQDKLYDYFQIFFREMHRWKAISLWVPYIPWKIFDGPSRLAAPLLEEVTLGAPSMFDLTLMARVISPLWTTMSPNLRSFTVDQRNEDTIHLTNLFEMSFFVPFQSLTTIHIGSKVTAGQCYELISFGAHNLVDCSFGNITGPAATGPPEPLYCFPLQSLKLTVNFEDHCIDQPTYLWSIFQFIRAPLLGHLAIESDDQWQNDIFLHFLKESSALGCQLQILEFTMVRMTDMDLHAILQITEGLKVLKFQGDVEQGAPISKCFIEKLVCQPESRCLCPQLEMLFLNDFAVEENIDGRLGSMIYSRATNGNLKGMWFLIDKDDGPDHEIEIKLMKWNELEVVKTGKTFTLQVVESVDPCPWDTVVRAKYKLERMDLSNPNPDECVLV